MNTHLVLRLYLTDIVLVLFHFFLKPTAHFYLFFLSPVTNWGKCPKLPLTLYLKHHCVLSRVIILVIAPMLMIQTYISILLSWVILAWISIYTRDIHICTTKLCLQINIIKNKFIIHRKDSFTSASSALSFF